MKRLLLGLLITIGVIAALAVVFFFGIGYYLSPQDSLTKADAIVAISGGETSTRTTEAIRLYRDGYAPNIIFSGAALDPNSPSNARIMARDALAQGVPAGAVFIDEAAKNTRENAIGVGKVVTQQQFKSIILVTSPYHQRRANLAFRHVLGKDFIILNHSSYDGQWRRSHWWATPYSQSLTIAELQKVLYELASGDAQ